MRTFTRFAPMLLCLALSLVAQIQTIPPITPPGSISADAATVVGWIMWLGGIAAILLIIGGFWALKNSHMGGGITAFVAAILCIIGWANAPAIARYVYHPQG